VYALEPCALYIARHRPRLTARFAGASASATERASGVAAWLVHFDHRPERRELQLPFVPPAALDAYAHPRGQAHAPSLRHCTTSRHHRGWKPHADCRPDRLPSTARSVTASSHVRLRIPIPNKNTELLGLRNTLSEYSAHDPRSLDAVTAKKAVTPKNR
jgi:hypothetical protein